MKRTCLCVLAAGMAWNTAAVAKPPLEKLSRGVRVDPVNVAKVKRVNGQIVLDGPWFPYTGGFDTRGPQVDAPFFDCFGRVGPLVPLESPGSHCVPNCSPQVDNGARWYFGSSYHNPNCIDDMQDCACPPGSIIDEIDLAWFWGDPVAHHHYIIFFPFEEVLGYTRPSCTDPSTMTDTGGGGVVLEFLSPDFQNIYLWSAVSGLGFLGVRAPWTDDNGNGLPDGSYQMIIAGTVTGSTITLATGPVQPMLWGTGDVMGECRPGYNNELAYDDDSPTDGVLSNPQECYEYWFAVCPEPLGKTVAFGYLRCPADFSNDGFVDGIDYDTFNNDFETGNKCADLNDDCFVDGIDADLFYNAFEAPC